MSIAIEPELDSISSDHPPCQEFISGQVISLCLPLSVRLKVTPDEFALLASLNRDLRLEMTAAGELIAMAPEGSWSAHLNFDLSIQLGRWVYTNSGLGFGSSAGFILPNGACRSPDLSWIATDRWNALAADEKSGFAHICPDFVVELRSPTDSIEQLKLKMQEYQENGARLGWLIDPLTKTVTIYRPCQEPETLVNPAKISGEAVLPSFELDTATIFSPANAS